MTIAPTSPTDLVMEVAMVSTVAALGKRSDGLRQWIPDFALLKVATTRSPRNAMMIQQVMIGLPEG